METDALTKKKNLYGLNPYYNGRYSWSFANKFGYEKSIYCLNPYYNGRYSWRKD